MATSATEYLNELIADQGSEFWVQVRRIAGTTWLFPGTEPPQWLIDAAFEALAETFTFPYWTDLPETLRDDVMLTVQRGVEEGLSIPELRDYIMDVRGPGYADYRATNTARTETGFMSNMGNKAAVAQLREETGMDIRRVWGSVFGSSTRPNHAAMDGEVTDENDKFHFRAQDGRTYIIDAPADPLLPAADRCNDQCFTLSEFVMGEVENDVLQEATEDLLATSASYEPSGKHLPG